MIRKWLAREVEFVLEEFDAPDVRTLMLRFIFWAYVTIVTTVVLLGLVWVGQNLGLEWMAAAVVVIILLCARMTRHAPLYIESGLWLQGNDQPALEPPRKQALPPPGTRALTPTVCSGTGRKALPPR